MMTVPHKMVELERMLDYRDSTVHGYLYTVLYRCFGILHAYIMCECEGFEILGERWCPVWGIL